MKSLGDDPGAGGEAKMSRTESPKYPSCRYATFLSFYLDIFRELHLEIVDCSSPTSFSQ